MLPILFEDDYLVAVNKPAGLFVHPTNLDAQAGLSVMQLLRDSIGAYVYPVHRLDRKTTGVLLFAKSREIQSVMNKLFLDKSVEKNYLAIVRGYTEDRGTIDYPLKNDKSKVQDAITHFRTLQRVEIPLPSGKFPTSRYSVVSLTPVTGRMHQLRKHMAHIFHPILGDRPYGCNKQNRLLLEKFELKDLMLHASELNFHHPISGHQVQINAQLLPEFIRILQLLQFDLP